MPRAKHRQDTFTIPPAGSQVLAYLRVSHEDGDIASQAAALRRWIEAKGWTVYPGGWFADEGKPGGSTEGRDQFHAMIRLAEQLADAPDRPVAIVTWRFNRFARNLLDAQFYKAALRRRGYVVVSMADDVPSGDFGFVIESLLDWKSAHDLDQLSGDILRSFDQLRARGFEPGSRPPRGLQVQREMIGQKKNGQPRYGRRWVADPALAPLVAQAFAMRAEGAGYTAILKGPLAGVYKSASCLPTVFANHRYVVGGVITEELFQRVQAVNLRHARKEGQAHPRRIASACLLSGLVFCRCESPMVGSTSSGRGYHYRYYRCTQQMNRRNDACNQPRIRADYLENAVLDSVLAHFQKPEQIAELTEAVNEELNGDDGLQAEADRLRQQIADVEAAIARLVAALEKGGHLESLLDSLKTREAERVRLRNDLLLVEAEIAARRPTVLTPQEVATLLGEIRQHREAEDTLELRAILRLVIERMVVEGESYQICYRPEVRPYFT